MHFMTNQELAWSQELAELFPKDYDPAFVPIWHASWCDYEESSYFYLLDYNGVWYVQEGGYSVMAEDNTDVWCPYQVSYDEAMEKLQDWEEYLD